MAAPGSHTFFHKPPVNPNLATLLHCTQISAINFPHCAVAHLSAVISSPPLPPPSFPHPSLSSPAPVSHPPASSCLSAAFPFASLSSITLPRLWPDSIPHRHIPSPLHSRSQAAVRIVIGKQISMAVLKVSALMEPAIFSPTKTRAEGRRWRSV